MSVRTAGRYQWRGGSWEIAADADAMNMFCRIIPEAQPTGNGTVLVTATESSSRHIEWFLELFPLQASTEDRQRLRSMSMQYRRTQRAVQAVLDGQALEVNSDWVKPVKPLREYQRVARDLVWASKGVVVADELGLGKTLTSLAILENPAARPALAVTLTGAMPQQWREELQEFYPTLTSIEVQTGPIHSLFWEGRMADLVVMNYPKLIKWQYKLKGLVKTVIFDEVHELRRGEAAKKYLAATTIAGEATYRVGLSATPIYNYGGEAYHVVNALKPGVLGSETEFAHRWCGASGLDTKTTVKDPEALHAFLTKSGLMLRRTREEVGIELPPAQAIQQAVPSDPDVLAKAEGNLVELAKIILARDSERSVRFRAAGQLDALMRKQTGIAKAPFVADYVRLLLESEERVILLGWHHIVQDIWMERLKDFKPRMYAGRQSSKQKKDTIEAFKHGDCRVMIMSLRSGAGIDGLQGVCSTIVFGELDWSPGAHKQAIGRLHRPGQKRPTMAYFCTSNDGADPVMIQVLNIKKLQAEGIVETGDPKPPEKISDAAQESRARQLATRILAHAQNGDLGRTA